MKQKLNITDRDFVTQRHQGFAIDTFAIQPNPVHAAKVAQVIAVVHLNQTAVSP